MNNDSKKMSIDSNPYDIKSKTYDYVSIISGSLEEKIENLTDKIINTLAKKIITYKDNSISNKITINNELGLANIDYLNMYQNFWSSFFGVLTNMLLDVSSTLFSSENRLVPKSKDFESTLFSSENRLVPKSKDFESTKIIYYNSECLNMINEFFCICNEYNKNIINALTINDYHVMFNLLDEFMQDLNIIVILIGIANCNSIHIHYIITSMKRWDNFKRGYLTDPLRNKYYKFICVINKLLDKESNNEKILDLLIVFIDTIIDSSSNDNLNNNNSGHKVIDLAFHTKSVILMDVFRDITDMTYYANILGCDKCNIPYMSSLKLIKLFTNNAKKCKEK